MLLLIGSKNEKNEAPKMVSLDCATLNYLGMFPLDQAQKLNTEFGSLKMTVESQFPTTRVTSCSDRSRTH